MNVAVEFWCSDCKGLTLHDITEKVALCVVCFEPHDMTLAERREARRLKYRGKDVAARVARWRREVAFKLQKLWWRWKYRHFDETQRYGDWEVDRESVRADVIARSYIAMEETIPPTHRHKVEWMWRKSRSWHIDPLSRAGYFSWKYNPKLTLERYEV